MSQYEFTVEGDKEGAPKQRVESATRLEPGDTVTLADGSKGKVKDVSLNVGTGRYDVTVKREKGEADAKGKADKAAKPAGDEAPAAKQVEERAVEERAKTAGRAVRDVTLDPKFSPDVNATDKSDAEWKKERAEREAAGQPATHEPIPARRGTATTRNTTAATAARAATNGKSAKPKRAVKKAPRKTAKASK